MILSALIYTFNISLMILMLRFFQLHVSNPRKMEAFWSRFFSVWIESGSGIFDITPLNTIENDVVVRPKVPVHWSLQNTLQVKKPVVESIENTANETTKPSTITFSKSISIKVNSQKPPLPQPNQRRFPIHSDHIDDSQFHLALMNSMVDRETVSPYSFDPIQVHCDPYVVMVPPPKPMNPLDKIPYIASVPFRVAETSFDIATDIAAGSIKLFVIKPIKLYTLPARYIYNKLK